MAPLRSAIISGMNFIFLSLSQPAGRDKLIFTQRSKTDRRDWRNPLRQNLTVLPAPPKGGSFICADRKMAKSSPFGGAGIEQSEMTERVSHPRAGTALLIRVKLQKLISLKRSHFKLFFCPKWSIMEATKLLPQLRLEQGRNLL